MQLVYRPLGIFLALLALITTKQTLHATCAPIPTNAVGWWRFDGTLTDQIFPDTGVLLGATNYAAGKVGSSLSFDGSSNRFKIPASSKTDLGSAAGFTVEGWIYPSSLAVSRSICHWYTGSSSGVHFFITVGTSANLYANIVTTTGGTKIISSAGDVLQLNTWQHVALTYDKNTGVARIYRNGSIVAEENLGSFTPQTTYDLVFGHNSIYPANYYSGRMDDMAIYKRSLSPQEIDIIYNAFSDGKCTSGIAPEINQQPRSMTNFVGQQMVLTVNVSGASPLHYQWFFNNSPIVSATNATLSIASVAMEHSGDYFAVITNAYGNVTSSIAKVTILPCGSTASEMVGWWPLDGSFANYVTGNSGTYTGPANSFVSGKVDLALSFNGSSKFVVPQADLNLSQNSGFTVEGWIYPTSLSVARPIFEWYMSGYQGVQFFITVGTSANLFANVRSATDNEISLSSPGSLVQIDTWQHVALSYDKNSGVGRIYLNGSVIAEQYLGVFAPLIQSDLVFGHNTSHPANYFAGHMDEMAVYSRALTANEIQLSSHKCKPAVSPAFGVQPIDLHVLEGVTTNLTANASGRPSPGYQWYHNGAVIPGATNNVLLLPNISTNRTGQYFVTASNSGGSIISRTAQVNVIPVGAPVVRITNVVAPKYLFTNAVAIQVQLQSSITNAAIFYTLDGTQPDFTSIPYGGPFTVSGSRAIRAVAYDSSFVSYTAPPVDLQFYHKLTVTSLGGGAVAISPTNAVYHDSSIVQLTAMPSAQWGFVNWQGQASGTDPVLNVLMDQPKTVQAVFGTTINLNAVGGGSFYLNPSMPLYPYGSQVQVVAVPAEGNHFALWGGVASGNINPYTITITNATPSISALFSSLPADRFALTVVPNGRGYITVSPRANLFTNGQTVTITATPAQEDRFYRWSGDLVSTNNPAVIVMNASKVIDADFTGGAYPLVVQSLGFSKTNNTVAFRITGEPTTAVTIEAGTELDVWTPVMTLTNGILGYSEFSEPVTNANKFYRAVAE